MFTVEEIWEEQERQYNQLMEEDDQYCHPESFRWGFEHGVDYALTKLGWHPASELPPLDEKGYSDDLIVICGTSNAFSNLPKWSQVVEGTWGDNDVKWWCYPPKED